MRPSTSTRLSRALAAPPSLAACLMLAGPAAHAARPMITDDARLVDPKSCQVESWVKDNRGSTEFWALPSCNFTGNLEVTIGGARGRDDQTGTRTTDLLFQGKTLFRRLEPDGWGWGLAFGNVRHPAVQTERNQYGDFYGYIPASFSFLGGRFVLHVNTGWLHDERERLHRMTYGVGTETQLTPRAWLIAEFFGQNQGRPFHQAGVRYWIVQDRVQVDATYGNRFGTALDERWFSIGLRLLSPAFLP